MLTCSKIQTCTDNQSSDMNILNSYSYCILSSIALLHVKMKIQKTAL